jgi:hypothetical protein
MDQDILVTTLKDHLDLTEKLIAGIIGISIVSAWAGRKPSQDITIVGLTVPQRHAFWILSTLFISATVTSAILIARISYILEYMNCDHLLEGLTTILTHKWPINPYAFYGHDWLGITLGSIGFGALIIIWWLGYWTLTLFHQGFTISKLLFLVSGFLFVGTTLYVGHIVLRELQSFAIMNTNQSRTIAISKIAAALTGAIAGFFLFAIVNKIREPANTAAQQVASGPAPAGAVTPPGPLLPRLPEIAGLGLSGTAGSALILVLVVGIATIGAVVLMSIATVKAFLLKYWIPVLVVVILGLTAFAGYALWNKHKGSKFRSPG